MSIAADNLNEFILASFQSFIIDAASVHLAKAVFAALGDKAAAVAGILAIEFFLVFVAHRGTVDDHVGALDRLFGLEAGFHSHFDEFLPALFVDGKLRSFPAGDHNFRAIGQ